MSSGPFFLESTFKDQINPKRQTADPLWGSPELDLVEWSYFERQCAAVLHEHAWRYISTPGATLACAAAAESPSP